MIEDGSKVTVEGLPLAGRTGRALKQEKQLVLIFLVKLGACISAENEEEQIKEEDMQRTNQVISMFHKSYK